MKMTKILLVLISLIFLSINTAAYSFIVSTGGYSPSPGNDVYYADYLTVGYNSSSYAYTGSPYMYPTLPAYGYGGYYPTYYGTNYYTYGGFAGITTPYYYGRPIIEPYMYQYYVYTPAPMYCTSYWCFA